MGNVIGKFVGVLVHPWASMSAVRAEGENASLKPAIIFVVIMGVISGVISSIWGFITPPPPVVAGQVSKLSILLAIPLVPAISFLLSFVGAMVLWGLVHGLIKGTQSEYKTIYRLFALLAAFSPLNALLSPIPTVGPWLGVAINIWGIVVLIRGIMIVVGTPPVRTGVVLGLIFLALLALGLVFRAETQRQLASGGPGFGGTDVNDLGDEEALNKELQDMANRAKTEGGATAPTPVPAAPGK
jgi:hypothetical protein